MKFSQILYFFLCGFISSLSFSTTAYAAEKPVFDVLFIGNSYTFYNNFPTTLEILVNNNLESKINIKVTSASQGGFDFKDQWEKGDVETIIKDGKWHYVVLQNQSGWATEEARIKEAHIYGKKMADAAKAAGAIPLLYETWPREIGSPDYKRYPWMKNYAHMYRSLDTNTKKVADFIGADIVDVNYYWTITQKEAKGIKLYTDGSHPNPTGSFLAALVFYKFFNGSPLLKPKAIPAGVGSLEAEIITQIVAREQ